MPNMMYHFVGTDEKLKGISFSDFKAQLDHLQESYGGDDLVLTFDHGTIDHIETAAPELERRGLRGIFFILTMVPEDHRVASIDQQRFLEADYRTALAEMICTDLGLPYEPETAADHLAEFGFYSLEERYIRYLRDFVIPASDYEQAIGHLFEDAFGSEAHFCARQYLSWDHIRDLHDRGHVIGSHSHDHYGDAADYGKSLDFIETAIGVRATKISYPNGNKRISNTELQALGIAVAYDSRPGKEDPFNAPRIDCNQFSIVPSGDAT